MATMRRGHLGFYHIQVVLLLLSVVARRAEKKQANKQRKN
jgi:hypothetical protein